MSTKTVLHVPEEDRVTVALSNYMLEPDKLEKTVLPMSPFGIDKAF